MLTFNIDKSTDTMGRIRMHFLPSGFVFPGSLLSLLPTSLETSLAPNSSSLGAIC